MRYVILRDDDTNVLTPPDCLERLYRPFLDAGLPVNLATIPAVSTDAKRPDGLPEAFLWRHASSEKRLPLQKEQMLVQYLRANPGFHVVQHGHHHDPFEFDRTDQAEIATRLEAGRALLQNAGFPRPETFVAPHDKFSPIGYREVASRYQVISTGWFELARLPRSWWPKYAIAKALRRPHWRVNGTMLLSHPGCLLSYMRPYDTMLEKIKAEVQSRSLTVLVTHWWEYFRDGQADDQFIAVLHSVADYLHSAKDVTVISFAELAAGKVPLD